MGAPGNDPRGWALVTDVGGRASLLRKTHTCLSAAAPPPRGGGSESAEPPTPHGLSLRPARAPEHRPPGPAHRRPPAPFSPGWAPATRCSSPRRPTAGRGPCRHRVTGRISIWHRARGPSACCLETAPPARNRREYAHGHLPRLPGFRGCPTCGCAPAEMHSQPQNQYSGRVGATRKHAQRD